MSRKMCNVRIHDLVEFKESLEKLDNPKVRDEFFCKATMRMGNHLMAKAKDNSPVGDYSKLLPPFNNRTGGTLRDSWKVGRPKKRGSSAYRITVENPQEYASYVNYGHKQNVGKYVSALGKKLKKRFIKGQRFLELSERQVKEDREELLRPLVVEHLNKVFKK